MGFKKSKDFNKALVAKLARMMASKRDSLCTNLLRSKYKVRENWFKVNLPKMLLQFWKAIEKTNPLLLRELVTLLEMVPPLMYGWTCGFLG